MRITKNLTRKKMQSGISSLKEACEKAPKTTGFYILSKEEEKLIIKVAKNSLREEFISLYNGFHLKGDIETKVYENRENIIAEWFEEYNLEDAEEYVKKANETDEFKWM